MNDASAPFVRRHAAELLLGILLVAGAAILLYWHRSIGVWGDEWSYLIRRDGFSAESLLHGHNGHLMVLPVLAYKAIGAVFEPAANEPLALLSVLMQCVLTVLVFVFIRRRSGEWFALGAAALVLFLGTGWEAVVWSFNFSWLAAMSAGIGALLVFEKEELPRRTLYTGLLLMTAMACAGVGSVFLLGVLTYALWGEHRRRALLATLPVIAVYALWFLAYGADDDSHGRYPGAIPDFFLEQAAAGFGGLLGTGSEWGRSLAVVGAIAALVALARRERATAADVSIVALPLFFWSLTSLQRAGWGDAAASRYIFTGGVLILMAASQLAARPRLNAVAAAGLVSVLLVAIGGNAVEMRAGAATMRSLTASSRAELTAFALAGRDSRPPEDFDPLDPALDPRDVPRVYELIAEGEVELTWDESTVERSDEATKQKVDTALRAVSPVLAKRGSFEPAGCGIPIYDEFVLRPDESQVAIDADENVEIFVRRYAGGFPAEPQQIAQGGQIFLSAPVDEVNTPWMVKLVSVGDVRRCN